MGLLNKLKSSFSGREGEVRSHERQAAPAQQASQSAPQQVTPAPRPAPAAPPRMENDPYAPKRGQLDSMGRINPSEKPAHEDDQLDIPAFLRRQAN